jgi:hypothetical protein
MTGEILIQKSLELVKKSPAPKQKKTMRQKRPRTVAGAGVPFL